jgi:hypothetical protein
MRRRSKRASGTKARDYYGEHLPDVPPRGMFPTLMRCEATRDAE